MPPKKKTEAPASQSKANEQAKQNPNAPGVPPKKESQPKSKSSSAVPAKRKAQAETKHAPSKAPRRSARGPSSAQPDPVKLIKHLLSPASLHACRPKDEIEDLRKRGKDLRTYSSSTFTPFEELICAVILSRPISHALGLRSIRTLFNEPHNFTTPKKIREAGFEPVRKALDEARTQHRQKTAEELVLLADAVAEHLGDGEEDVALERVRRECGYDWPKEKEMMKTHVKGLGKTGLDIFARRIQAVWLEPYPFADQRTLSGLQKLGLPGTAEELKKLVDDHWAELDVKSYPGDEEEKKRRAFVQVLERAVGVDLEGNADAVKAEATPRSE
ncbi:MAG: hypothetical protein LQ352_001490 [Teloschistes flavicans]|nr:MAG: hypothetical protein LQ352_001490 [Teloschistes flavicans]